MIPKRMTTKEVILYVAGQLFMDKGFQATSTRDIAENSGITQPNLYHHFKTKEAIYIAVLEKLSSEIKEGLEELVNNPTGSLVEDLVKILNFLKDNHPANFSIMRHDMTYEISEENHYRLYLTWQDAYLKPIVAMFNHYTQDSSPYTADELARFFYSSIAPFIQKDNRFHKKVEPEKIVHIFVNGIYH